MVLCIRGAVSLCNICGYFSLLLFFKPKSNNMSPASRPNLRSDEGPTPLEAQLPWVCSEECMRAKKPLVIKSHLDVFVNSISLSPSVSHSSCQYVWGGRGRGSGKLSQKVPRHSDRLDSTVLVISSLSSASPTSKAAWRCQSFFRILLTVQTTDTLVNPFTKDKKAMQALSC